MELSAPPNALPHLSPLERQIVDYVLEVAAIHMDDDSPPYHLTVGSIAEYMNKSARQISAALRRLIANRYLECDHKSGTTRYERPRSIVYPTSTALRTLPYFSDSAEETLRSELAKLLV